MDSLRVLALIGDRPYPPITGCRVRNYYLWRRVARLEGVELKVLNLDLALDSSREPATFPEVDAEFFRFRRAALPARVLGAFVRSWHEYPRSSELDQRVDDVAESWAPDVIHAEELRMATYLPAMRGRRTPALQSITFHNVESELFEKLASPATPIARGLSRRLQVASLRRFETHAVASAGLLLAYSPEDRRRYQARYPRASWGVTRNGTDVLGIEPAPQVAARNVLLVGRWCYAPNREGLVWFLDRIRPRLDQTTRLTVAGSGADDVVRSWVAEAGGTFVDTPMDLRPLYAAAAAVAVPVLDGSGTRGRILEALAHRHLVVTTIKGSEGLSLGPDEGVIAADRPGEFARRLGEVLSSPPEVRDEMAGRGRQAMLTRFDWSVVATELLEAWRACVSH